MLVLHHAGPSVTSMKVRLVLNEKAVPWEGTMLNLRGGDQFQPDYRKLNPNAVVPTLVHDGHPVIESTVIMEYLDEAFPSPALMPGDPYRRSVVRGWMRRIDDLHLGCVALTFAIVFRRRLSGKTPAEIDGLFAPIPNRAMREGQTRAVLDGIDAPQVQSAIEGYDELIAGMEETLARSAYLAGDAYTLADAAATPYLYRASLLGMEGLWSGSRPHVADWFERMRMRPSFDQSVTRFLTDRDRDDFDIPRSEAWQAIQPVLGKSGQKSS